jgi:hypothetical protein
VLSNPLASVSRPARVAEPREGVSADELQLAARNAGMPLAELRYDVTPPGLHYLLIHYDIPLLGRQPSEQPWNRGGFANNLVHRVPVLVEPAP